MAESTVTRDLFNHAAASTIHLGGWFTAITYYRVSGGDEFAFFAFADSSLKPRLAIINLTTGATIAHGLVANHSLQDNDHHSVSIGVDENGFLHLMMGMHNSTTGITSHASYPPYGWQYYKSNIAGHLMSSVSPSGFTFQGSLGAPKHPDGERVTYYRFFNDRLGRLYLTFRGHSGVNYAPPTSDTWLAGSHGGHLHFYNAATGNWTARGAIPPGSTKSWKVVFWENAGVGGSAYQGYMTDIWFDGDDILHAVCTVNSNNGGSGTATGMTDIMYVYSTDYGITWKNIFGVNVPLPVRKSTAPTGTSILFDPGGGIGTGINIGVRTSDKYPLIMFLRNSNQRWLARWTGSAWAYQNIAGQGMDDLWGGRMIFFDLENELYYTKGDFANFGFHYTRIPNYNPAVTFNSSNYPLGDGTNERYNMADTTFNNRPTPSYPYATLTDNLLAHSMNPARTVIKLQQAVFNDPPEPEPVPDQVVSFTLLDYATGIPIPGYDPIANGASINYLALPVTELNIRANVVGDTLESVVIDLTDNDDGSQDENTTDNAAPYVLFSAPWTPDAESYTLTATPYDEDDGAGNDGIPLTINFGFVNLPVTQVSTALRPIRAVFDLGMGDVLSGVSPAPVPTNFRSPAQNATQALLMWVHVGATSYELQVSASGSGGWSTEVNDRILGYVHTRTASTTMFYRLRAHMADGSVSAWTPVLQVTTPATSLGTDATEMWLVDASADTEIVEISDKDAFNTSSTGTSLNIRVYAPPESGHTVRFHYDAQDSFKNEGVSPYALGGDSGGDYAVMNFSNGLHVVAAHTINLSNNLIGNIIVRTFDVFVSIDMLYDDYTMLYDTYQLKY